MILRISEGLPRESFSRSVRPVSHKLPLVLALLSVLLPGALALAQEAAVRYIDYPQLQGKVQPLKLEVVPKWATIDFQLRGRFENQSSDNYISGNNQSYLLTRVYGGLEIRPTNWLTGYIQFIDTHALGLPLKYVSANQRDVFDDRQAYLEFHLKQVRSSQDGRS